MPKDSLVHTRRHMLQMFQEKFVSTVTFQQMAGRVLIRQVRSVMLFCSQASLSKSKKELFGPLAFASIQRFSHFMLSLKVGLLQLSEACWPSVVTKQN